MSKLIWSALDLIMFGSIAVKILHIDTDPSRLELAIGWAALVLAVIAVVRLGLAIDAARSGTA
jgi:hypothetical protein